MRFFTGTQMPGSAIIQFTSNIESSIKGKDNLLRIGLAF